MNIPCPICNHLHEQRLSAFRRREFATLKHYEEEHEKHREKCETVNSSWYQGLWQSARIGTDTTYPESAGA